MIRTARIVWAGVFHFNRMLDVTLSGERIGPRSCRSEFVLPNKSPSY